MLMLVHKLLYRCQQSVPTHNNVVRSCKHLGGTPPLGYGVDPGTHKYIINEKETKFWTHNKQ